MRKTHFAMENKLCRTEELSKSLPIILGMVWKKEVERVILGHGIGQWFSMKFWIVSFKKFLDNLSRLIGKLIFTNDFNEQ